MVKTVRLSGVDLRSLAIRTNPPPAPFPVITAAPDTGVQEPSSASGSAYATLEILPLTPVFTTQGGPGCVAIQVVKEL